MPLWAEHVIGSFGYLALFLLIAVEGLGIPLPGETALVVAAALAGTGRLDIRAVIAVAALAAAAGDMAGYAIGRHMGRQALDRWGPRVGLTPPRVARIDRFFRRYGDLAVFFGRYQAVFRTYLALFAGIARMPFPRFFVVRTASCVLWAALFGVTAYHLGHNWPLLEAILHRFGLAAGAAAVLAAALAAVTWQHHRAEG